MTDQMANIMNVQGYAGLANPNPYLQFTGQIPLAGYAGTPTDAQGRPIAGYNPPGTTLNTPPAAAAAPTGTPDLSGLMQQLQLGQMNQGSFGGTGQVQGQPAGGAAAQFNQANMDNIQRMMNMARASAPQSNPAAASAATAAQPNNAAAQRQAYLSALANPGQVTTPGAQMMPGAQPTGTPQPSVLAQFLAAHPSGGTTGAGGYTNVPFFNTLKALQQGSSGTPGTAGAR